jgi:hypothetical protein
VRSLRRMRSSLTNATCGIERRAMVSRPFRPQDGVPFFPRASAFGLGPGLRSPDPLGRTGAGHWHLRHAADVIMGMFLA